MASKAQRAVTGVAHERWGQLGKTLQAWREDELGYQARSRFADDRDINLRLVQDLEHNYRQSYTRWKLRDTARAYKITYESILAFLRGNTDTLYRVQDAPAEQPAAIDERALPPSPFDDPDRTAADLPYAEAIWDRYLDLPRRVTDPTGAQLGLPAEDVRVFDGTAGRMDLGNQVWLIADLQRRGDGRRDPGAESGAAGA